MALILPKGIVVNSAEIEGQIERINAEPLDPKEIAKLWKVYTTTKRRLLDPTAERLENYWWRIWGSRRRELNGATVARLFAYISDGQSFVALRGPANRDEGTPPLNRTARLGPGAASATTLHRPSQSRPSTTSSSNASKAPVVMPHPILKKTRGPSSTGPRPTARFISPHESEAETGTTTNSSSTRSVSPNSHVVVQPPSPESQNSKADKKSGVAKKPGRVVSTAAKKSRPKITKRQSSQSSTDSAAKVEAENVNISSVERTPPTLADDARSKGKIPSRFQENFSPEHLAAQSPKRRQPSKSDPKRTSPRKPSRKKSREERREESTIVQGTADEPGPSSLRPVETKQQNPAEDVSEEELELQRTLLEKANARVEDAQGQDTSGIRLKSSAILAPTLAAATEELDLSDSIPLPQVTSSRGKDKGKGIDQDLFAKRPVPSISSGTPIAPIPDGPLARSKSQLTLLLEKDRAKKG